MILWGNNPVFLLQNSNQLSDLQFIHTGNRLLPHKTVQCSYYDLNVIVFKDPVDSIL